MLREEHELGEITLALGTPHLDGRFADTPLPHSRIGGAENEAPVPRIRRGFFTSDSVIYREGARHRPATFPNESRLWIVMRSRSRHPGTLKQKKGERAPRPAPPVSVVQSISL